MLSPSEVRVSGRNIHLSSLLLRIDVMFDKCFSTFSIVVYFASPRKLLSVRLVVLEEVYYDSGI